MERIIFTLLVAILTHALYLKASAADGRFTLDALVYEAVFDPPRSRAYLLTSAAEAVVVINLQSRSIEKTIPVAMARQALALSPDGTRLYAASTRRYSVLPGRPANGTVAVIDTATLQVVKTFTVEIDPFDMVATDDGKLVISSAGVGGVIGVFYAANGAHLGNSFQLNPEVRLALHPSQSIVYGADSVPVPDGFHHVALSSTGSVSAQWTVPYTAPRDYDVFALPDGKRLLTSSGKFLTSSTNQQADLQPAGHIGYGISSVAFRTNGNVLAAATTNAIIYYNYASNQVVEVRNTPGAKFVGFMGETTVVIVDHQEGYGAEVRYLYPAAKTAEENRTPSAILTPPWSDIVRVANTPYLLRVEGRDEDGWVQSVRILQGTNTLVTSTQTVASAYAIIAPGTNEFRAIASDNFGATGTSAVVRVIGNLPPQVAIQPLLDNYSSLSDVLVRITASDPDGSIRSVRLFANNVQVARFTAPPYEFSYRPPAPGSYTFRAEATDDRSEVRNSPNVVVRFTGAADDFSSGLTIETSTNRTFTSSNVGATRQKDEPLHAGVAGGQSIWYAWRSSGSGTAVMDTLGSDFDTTLAVYALWTNTAPASFSNLRLVAENDDDPSAPPASRVKFSTSPNQVYYIAVDGREGVAGNVVLRVNFTRELQLANDHFANATNFFAETITANNVGGSKEKGEPNHGENTGGASVWWRRTFSPGTLIQITTTNSTFDTLLAVYTTNNVGYKPTPAALSDLVLIAENDDAQPRVRTSTVRFVPRTQSTYWIAVDGYNGVEGNIRLSVSTLPIPNQTNNAFASAITLGGVSVLTNGHNLTATVEPGEPRHAAKTTTNSVWYRWVAPTNGPVSISTRTSGFDTVLAVYTGSSLTNLTEIASNDDDPANPPTSAVIFHATAETEYRIAISGYQTARGEYVLALNQTPTFQPRLLSQWMQGKLWLEPELGSAPAILESSTDLVTWRVVQTLQPGDPAIAITTDAGVEMLFFRIRQEAE